MCDLKDDLVRRGDVMDELVKEYNRRWQEGGLKLAWIEKAVNSAGPVREKIIRCKECKWYGEPGCAVRIVDDTDKPSDMDFCSFAERLTDAPFLEHRSGDE